MQFCIITFISDSLGREDKLLLKCGERNGEVDNVHYRSHIKCMSGCFFLRDKLTCFNKRWSLIVHISTKLLLVTGIILYTQFQVLKLNCAEGKQLNYQRKYQVAII